MRERTKLYVDMLKGFSLGFFGAVLFRDFTLLANVLFTLAGLITFVTAWALTGRADRAR